MRLLRTEYKVENNLPIVYLFTRDENGKRTIKKDSSLVPYYYIQSDNKESHYISIDGLPLLKIETQLPSDVADQRGNYKHTWEADVLFPLRFLIDKVDSLEKTKPRIMFLDIEVLPKGGRFPDPKIAQEPIICMAVHDNLDDMFVSFAYRADLTPGTTTKMFKDKLHEIRYFRTEIDMLKDFIKYFRENSPDVLSGWNLKRFDLTYLLNRMYLLGMPLNQLSPIDSAYMREDKDIEIKGVALVDLYDAYRLLSSGEEESFKLDFIAKKVIGEGKTDAETNIAYLYKFDLDALINYNATDVYINKGIDDKLGLLDFMDEVRRLAFCRLEDVLATSRVSDAYILRLFHGKKIFPTKEKHEREAFEGALVGSWAKGLYDNVAAFDVKSLYPSLIVSANLSPEVMDEYFDWKNNHKDMTMKQYISEFVKE